MEKQKKERKSQKQKSAKAVHSIKTTICLIVDGAVILTGLLMLFMYTPNVKNEIGTLSKHYIEDLSEAFGSSLDTEIKRADGKTTSVLNTDSLSLMLDGVGMAGIESSYIYVVSKSGAVLYHPDGSRIGKSIDNDIVRQVCYDLEKGNKIENGLITYDYNGSVQYASVYASTYGEFVLVVTADQSELFQPVSRMNRMGVIAIVVIAILLMFAGYMMASIIVKPIQKMTDETIRISHMDFTESEILQNLNKRKDEIGSMSKGISLLRRELVDVVMRIKKQSDILSNASNDLNSSTAETSQTMTQVENAVNEIAQGASAQAAETQVATENVVTVGKMVQETNQVVGELTQYAAKMKESGQNANTILKELETVNKQTEKYIGVIAKQTDTTNASVQKISQAATMITEIAEETNLLSLNASIEAARAGEQGKGFAVVASQIQKLAEQSNQSAQQIGDIIEVLIQDSEKAVEIMSDLKESMKVQSEHVARTEQAFVEIQNEVDSSIEGMQRISEKTKQMDDARSKVIDVVQELTAIAEQNAASTEETSAAVVQVSAIIGGISEKSDELKRIADEMDSGMSVFRI
ncbi:MAG: methyl-accepting chemotaxis protein [Lachnospiraceae bacterium]|nr:methyl-accepting chemotaxis protein [Lachnospiraceae bacterium]